MLAVSVKAPNAPPQSRHSHNSTRTRENCGTLAKNESPAYEAYRETERTHQYWLFIIPLIGQLTTAHMR